MSRDVDAVRRRSDADLGLDALRRAVLEVLVPPRAEPLLAGAHGTVGPLQPWDPPRPRRTGGSGDPGPGAAVSSAETEQERTRLIALVELARGGDREAFGQLFDHYHADVYRFLHHRTRSAVLAEDLTSETFFRALRSLDGFRWQGRDFGAWLTTIARNLALDHFKAGRTRRETSTDDMAVHDAPAPGPEQEVMTRLTQEVLLRTLQKLPDEQRDCLVLRFLQGLSIAETAEVLQRSEGAVKQLQLRAVRNLAKRLPEGTAGP